MLELKRQVVVGQIELMEYLAHKKLVNPMQHLTHLNKLPKLTVVYLIVSAGRDSR